MPVMLAELMTVSSNALLRTKQWAHRKEWKLMAAACGLPALQASMSISICQASWSDKLTACMHELSM